MLRSLFTAALPLSLILTACGGGGSDGDDGDDTMVTPEGEHYKGVVKTAEVPTTQNQARSFGLDLGSPDGSGPDGSGDNQLGMVLSTLSSMNIDVQGSVSQAVLDGSIILLTDLQTKDFTAADKVGFTVHLGENPMPAACTDANDMVTCSDASPPVCTGCGKHLTGSGMFSIKASGVSDTPLTGKIVGGKLTAGPGNLTIQIALGGADPITLDLIGARIEGTDISATGIKTLKVGGALPQEELTTQVLPAIQAQLGPTITRDCPPPYANPVGNCNCTSGTTGATVLQLFDSAPKDCMVTVAEIQANTLIQSLLAPDVKIDGTEALSLGIQVETTGATF
ncbi:MAG TPA: hypothetical protein VGM39_20885 [Kofleriaceae bacterium]|jgi:hypothetical protein